MVQLHPWLVRHRLLEQIDRIGRRLERIHADVVLTAPVGTSQDAFGPRSFIGADIEDDAGCRQVHIDEDVRVLARGRRRT